MKDKAPPLTDQQVRDYLLANPAFFEQHPEWLTDLSLLHSSGAATSLIEKQVSVLRQRNTELRNKLNQLVENARENDRLFERTKRLVLALIECDDTADLVDALYFSFDKEFSIPYTRVFLCGDDFTDTNARWVNPEEARLKLGAHFQTARTQTGYLSTDDIKYLFDQDAPKIHSAALAVFGITDPLGLIAIGHPSASYYESGMGTLFLRHIADVFGSRVYKLLQNRVRHDSLV